MDFPQQLEACVKQAKLQQAEQRVQILLSDNEDTSLPPFTPDNE